MVGGIFKEQEKIMLAYLWPIGLVMLSSIVYQICAKEVPAKMNAFATLTICYGVATLATFICYFVFSGSGPGGLIGEYAKINWAVIMLGITAVGLEVGYVFSYKNGWEVSLAYIVQSSLMTVLLLFVGYFVFSEGITVNKLVGAAACLAGLIMINKK